MRDQPGNKHDKEGRPLAVAYIRFPAAGNRAMTEYVDSRHREEQDMLVRGAARWDGTRIVEVFSDPATDNHPRQREGFQAMRELMKTEGIAVCYMLTSEMLSGDEELVDYYRDRFGDYRTQSPLYRGVTTAPPLGSLRVGRRGTRKEAE